MEENYHFLIGEVQRIYGAILYVGGFISGILIAHGVVSRWSDGYK
ncbi:hypothetical protein SAMN05446037_100321 [Anaerovirgula multivorans]|uniref:Uncharacterized protein n=1 Tax=Anaerovirgula multivorans TaxID=312168 RepID=A0A239B779_9FIRM|nr:hypothetical protein SAMN05446037_100321 [Anaerovirgula multivorans]